MLLAKLGILAFLAGILALVLALWLVAELFFTD